MMEGGAFVLSEVGQDSMTEKPLGYRISVTKKDATKEMHYVFPPTPTSRPKNGRTCADIRKTDYDYIDSAPQNVSTFPKTEEDSCPSPIMQHTTGHLHAKNKISPQDLARQRIMKKFREQLRSQFQSASSHLDHNLARYLKSNPEAAKELLEISSNSSSSALSFQLHQTSADDVDIMVDQWMADHPILSRMIPILIVLVLFIGIVWLTVSSIDAQLDASYNFHQC